MQRDQQHIADCIPKDQAQIARGSGASWGACFPEGKQVVNHYPHEPGEVRKPRAVGFGPTVHRV